MASGGWLESFCCEAAEVTETGVTPLSGNPDSGGTVGGEGANAQHPSKVGQIRSYSINAAAAQLQVSLAKNN